MSLELAADIVESIGGFVGLILGWIGRFVHRLMQAEFGYTITDGKHQLSEEYLARETARPVTTRKRPKQHVDDIEDLPSKPHEKTPVVVSRESIQSTGSAKSMPRETPDNCPGFFPTCGSGVSCDECTSQNRIHVNQVETTKAPYNNPSFIDKMNY